MENRTKYKNDYAKENYKRVPLNLKKEEFEKVQAAAAAEGTPVNTWIKKAIAEKLETESGA